VDRDIKLYSFQLNSSQLKLHVITSCRHWLLHCVEDAAFLYHTAVDSLTDVQNLVKTALVAVKQSHHAGPDYPLG